MDTSEVDVLVAGSGSAGLTTAIVAAQAGLNVLVVEKTRYFGGATAVSGGGVWIPNHSRMSTLGLTDSEAAARRYVTQVVGRHLQRPMLDAFLANGPAMLDHMHATTAVQLAPRPGPDYFAELDGGSMGRSLAPLIYDGRRLGAYFERLRPPIREFNAPWGMMFSVPDVNEAMAAFRSWRSFVATTRLFARFARDRLSYSRGTRLTMGNALAARLLQSALDARVKLQAASALKRLLLDKGRVVGAIVEREGAEQKILARRGVVLATGGFAANPALRRKFYPAADQHHTLVPEGNVGDGHRVAVEVGAALNEVNAQNGVWAVVSLLRRPGGTQVVCPHFFLDMPKPGCIAVNARGERFGNEASLRLVNDMHATGAIPAFLVCDRPFLERYGFGLVLPHGLRLRRLKRAGYVVEGTTPEELAGKLGIDAAGLARTLQRVNGQADAGRDADFGKGGCAFDRSLGDPEHRPNPCLGRIETPPFYGLRVFPGDTSSTAGLRTTPRGEVVDEAALPIPGLYACGLDVNSMWSGLTPANGAYHGVNMTFGYIIGRALALENSAATLRGAAATVLGTRELRGANT